jgi:uncharacterized protein (TIGR03067 family)
MARFGLLAVLFALPVSGGAGQDLPNKEDLQKLQGKWELVSATYDGKPRAPSPFPGKVIWTIAKNKLTYPPPRTKDGKVAGPPEEDEITIDATKKPKAIDVRQVREGKEPVVQRAIYALDGDQLKICADMADKGRPEAFESKAGSGRSLIILKRAEK